MHKKLIIPLIFGFCLSIVAGAQNIRKPIRNYTNMDYGRIYDALNLAIVVDDRNLVFSGNANGILSYNGRNWSFIPVRQGAYVTSLDKAPDGTIYVGSQNEFGYLDHDAKGQLVYTSLSDSLPEEDRFFSTIWKTYATGERVYFQAYEAVFVYDGKKISVIYPETSFHTSFYVNGRFYARERGKGLMSLESDLLSLVPGGERFADLGIFAMLNLEGEDIFLVTQEAGFFRYDPSSTSSAFRSLYPTHEDFILQSQIIGGIKLYDGHFALNTLSEGLLIVDGQGEILSIINKNSGLRVNDIKSVSQDDFHNLWLALNNGISKVDYASPISYYRDNTGLSGSIHSIIKYKGLFYVGTSNGLFVQEDQNMLTQSYRFAEIPNFAYQVWNLNIINGQLIVGTNEGLYTLRTNRPRQISEINAFSVYYEPENRILYVGGSDGLVAFKKYGPWREIKRFDDVKINIKGIAENRSSLYEGTELWLGSSFQGIVKLIITPDMSCRFTRYTGEFDGLSDDWVLPFSLGDSVVFGNRQGMQVFTDEMIVRESVPDSLKDDENFTRGFFSPASFMQNDMNLPLSAVREQEQFVYLVLDNRVVAFEKESGAMITDPFKAIDMGKINTLYTGPEGLLWIGAADGLIRYDVNQEKEFDKVYHALLNRTSTFNDSVLYFGHLPAGELRDYNPVLDFKLNHIEFTYSAPYYDQEEKIEFSYRLHGYDTAWSKWSKLTAAPFTNLKEGDYAFEVKAINVYDHESLPASFDFTVLPPWYRTLLAYIAYGLLLLLIIYLAIQISLRRLREKNERLEQLVRERTAEIRAKNITLERQKKEITDSIHYAYRIQNAVLPEHDFLEECFKGHFIFFKPRDIVSGDFYWISESNGQIVVIAADCTGHGVPGAFMSMLGVSFLNKIIRENGITDPDEILEKLRGNVIESLHQRGKENEAKDGMDMALTVIDKDKKIMRFAGANNPLYLIKSNELQETKADRMPVAIHERIEPFRKHQVELEQGDTFYLFSDGYADQFGGPDGKKFKYKQFKELLLSIQDRSMEEQKDILDKTLHEWINTPDPDGNPYDQIDDILVIGVRI